MDPSLSLVDCSGMGRGPNVDVLQLAARNIEKCLQKDGSAPTLAEQLNINLQQHSVGSAASVSGLSDHDYPSLLGLLQQQQQQQLLTHIKTVAKVPLPPELLEHFNHMQCHCTMGLFPKISRAWLTIDSDIYLWTYNEGGAGGDVAYYDGLNETIISVGLCQPKAGVFQPYVKWLLVLTTATDITVLGVTFSTEDEEEIQLVTEPVFVLPTDGVIITTVTGTALGRMFLGTKDGSVHEITYQAESSWFGRRCKRVNHSASRLGFLVPAFAALGAAVAAGIDDNGIVQLIVDDSRHVLYTLNEKGTIEVYDLGAQGTSMSKVTKIAQNTLANQAHNAVKTLDSQNFHPIVSISVIDATESPLLALVAITQAGVRLYLTVYNTLVNLPQQRPSTLTLVHVRLPPGFSQQQRYGPTRNVHLASYRDRGGVMVTGNVESGTGGKEVLWCLTSDLYPFAPVLMEMCAHVELDGTVLAIAEVRQEAEYSLQQSAHLSPLPPLVVRQHAEPPRKYVILTAQGVHVIVQMRPVDLLKKLLLMQHTDDTETLLRAFFTILQHAEQACATSLILASLDAPQHLDVSDCATNAFFVFGGEPKLTSGPMLGGASMLNQTANPYGTTMFLPNIMSTPMQQHSPFQTMQNVSFNTTAPNVNNQSALWDPNSPFQYSAKHTGLYLFLGRILRPIWNLRCVEKVTTDGKKFYFMSTLKSEECSWILCHLLALKGFLQKNTQLNASSSMMCKSANNTTQQHSFSASTTVANTTTAEDVQLEERQSLVALQKMVTHSAEVIGLWKVLCEHQLHLLIERLPPQQHQLQQGLHNTCFKEILLYGHDVCTAFINILIDSYLGGDTSGASVDSISAKLREVCPSLYRVEDAACSKANEMLKAAKTLHRSNDEREDLLQRALALCKQVAPHVNLVDLCQQFSAQACYGAVVDLSITCARRLDPENVGLHFYKNNNSSGNGNVTGGAHKDDQEGYHYYLKRMECYKPIINMLETVHVQQQEKVINISGQSTADSGDTMTKQIIMNFVMTRTAGHDEDELCQVAVYEWMLGKQMNGDLVRIGKPSLETYLLKVVQHGNSNVANVMDVLWKYYETNENHAAAAKVLNSLAISTNNPSITLKDRIGYLTRALMCIRNDRIGYAPYLGTFMRELEDRLDIARVQERILDAVTKLDQRRRHGGDLEQAIALLNSGLYEITQLYEDFAEKFDLWECKLAIIDCAGYSDVKLVENIWRNILQIELNRSTSDGNDKILHILSKVKTLVRAHKQNTACVPLEYLIQELEYLSAHLRGDCSLVPNFFISAGYSTETLITMYNEVMLHSYKNNFWQQEENQFRFSEAMATIINNFVTTHDKYSNVEKRKIISLAQDTVAGLLSSLYSKANTERIISMLRSIQTRLQRM